MNNSALFVRRVLVFVFFFGLLTISNGHSTPTLAFASPITVNTTDILDDPNDGNCDLFEALKAAFQQKSNSNSPVTYHECTAADGAKEVVFSGSAAGGTIAIPTGPGALGLPFINDDVTITGPVILDGGGSERIITVAASGTLTLVNLTMQNGFTSGGGGAILSNGGAINIIGSSILGNEADNDGGAINTSGELTILATNFAGNTAGRDGGAIYQGSSHRDMQISLSVFNGNKAANSGGALHIRTDNAQISDTIFNGNILTDDNAGNNPDGGGAIYMHQSELSLERSVFNGNLSFDGPGGAIATSLSTELTISDSSFNGNIAGDLGTAHRGGAIYNMETLNIRGATFLNNLSASGDGGAIFNDKGGELDGANVTFSANGAPSGEGGAVYNGNTQQGSNIASKVTFRNVTLYANIANGDSAAFFNQTGNHTISLGNTIIDDAGGPKYNCNRSLSSLGNNLDSGSSCGLNGSGDLSNATADLETISFNGGPLADLFTHLPGENSDAIDAGSNSICSAEPVNNKDQTGALRPKDGDANGVPICDIGAVEGEARIPGYGSTPIQPGPLHIGTTTGVTPITNGLRVFETGNATLTVSNPSLGGPHAADFELVAPFTSFDIANGGSAVTIDIRCTPTVDGTRTATFSLNTNDPLHPSVTYDLTCHRQPTPTAGFGSTPAVPGPLNFGATQTGNSVGRTLSIFETGNATLTFGSAALSGANPGDFSFGAFATSIPDGDPAVNIAITCTPSGVGLRTALLSMSSNDPANPSVSWNLVCEGTPPPPPWLESPGQSINSPVNVMDGIYGVAVSPDGQHLYATAFNDDQVLVFARDLISGHLTYLMAITNAGVNGPQLLAVSPDGEQVYVAGGLSNSLVVFSRNSATGFLSTDDIITSSSLLMGAYGVAVSPNGRFIYVTSLINSNVIGYERMPDNSLAYRSGNSVFTHVDLSQPRNLIVSPDGRNLYVTADPASNADNGNILVYNIDPLTGALTHAQSIHEGDLYGGPVFFSKINGLGGAFDVAVSPDGGHVYVVGTYDGAVVTFRRDTVTGLLTYGGGVRDGVGGVDGLSGVSGIDISPDGVNVVTTAYNDDAVAVFERNADNGRLSPVQVIQRGGLPNFVPRLNGARDIDLSPDGTTIHAAAFLDDAIVTLHTINPIPVLETVSPASATAGGDALTLTLSGQRFLPGAEVLVDGNNRSATYISETTLQTTLSAGDVASAGSLALRVSNPTPGGGQSVEALSFVVTAVNQNPIPAIDTILPQGMLAGGGVDVEITVQGSHFLPSSVVRWNGVDQATTYVNANTLKVIISAADLSAVGTAVITLFNPAPGGGTSNSVGFTINAPWHNPVPTILSLAPAEVTQLGPTGTSITVRVHGLGFIEDSQVQWNGADRPTQYIDETELAVTLTAVDVTPAGVSNITVQNPPSGGGTSNSIPFTLIRFPYGLFIPMVVR